MAGCVVTCYRNTASVIERWAERARRFGIDGHRAVIIFV